MIELLWNAPVSEDKMAKIIDSLELIENHKVLDFGCGSGEFLIRLVEQYNIIGTGIDSSEIHIAEANRRSSSRVPGRQIEFFVADAQTHHVPVASLDLAICMGATHAFGLGANAYTNAIEQMMPSVVPGGLLLVAEGYMKQPAPLEYKIIIGDSIPDEMTHSANVATGKSLGLTPLAAWTSSEDEWDDFEWNYQRIVEAQASANINDENISAKVAQRREWMEGYLNWGRDTLGYGTYLFRKPQT